MGVHIANTTRKIFSGAVNLTTNPLPVYYGPHPRPMSHITRQFIFFDLLLAGIVLSGFKFSHKLFSLLIPFFFSWYVATHYDTEPWDVAFWAVFMLRYLRLLGHVIGAVIYRPTRKESIFYDRQDVTVILPTIDPNGPDFKECVQSILANEPGALLVVTVGSRLLDECKKVLTELKKDAPNTRLSAGSYPIASKRRQVAYAMPLVDTAITIMADDHVFWPSTNFIPSIVAPFENPRIGVVATKKRVRRTTPGKISWDSLVNFIACNYLQRHNWELRATCGIDEGVFVVSGRTAAYRTSFLKDPRLLNRFCSEKFFFGRYGGSIGLGPDDDNFLTREALKRGLRIRFQDTEDATIETTLGEWPKFSGQLLRWARTTFRSNPVMLRDKGFFERYTWSYFMVYFAGLVNFALLWDATLVLTYVMSDLCEKWPVSFLLGWMFFTKTIKLWPHFYRYPSDIFLMPFQVTFGYMHSIIKLWALVTFQDCNWSGRSLNAISDDPVAAAFEELYRELRKERWISSYEAEMRRRLLAW